MTYITLFLEFFKTGLFAIGGGMATLPFLYELTKYGWYTMPELMDMIAVAESTPGPIGVNMATYAGFRAGGILGSLTATVGLVMPSVIIVILVFKVLEKFRKTPLVENAFYGLRPAVAGLITVACSELFKLTMLKEITNGFFSIFDYKALILFAVITVGVFKFKKIHPIVFIAIGALCGIIFKM
ncbi:MAG: chromate transporter [Clostridia bacterium]|nr:chromate transporter [Clostridia bacterium]